MVQMDEAVFYHLHQGGGGFYSRWVSLGMSELSLLSFNTKLKKPSSGGTIDFHQDKDDIAALSLFFF